MSTDEPTHNQQRSKRRASALIGVSAAALVAVLIALVGNATTQKTSQETMPAGATSTLWKDKDADGDGIPNGEDDSINGPERAVLCKEFDGGAQTSVSPDTSESVKTIFRAGIASNCPEHLASFDAAVAPPSPVQSTAPQQEAPQPAVPAAPAPPTTTTPQQQAVSTARDYLRSSSFSRSGLIDQLEFEGFSTADAAYAVDTVNPDWNQQALGSARDYLRSSGFSRSGLIGQLEFEGFTNSQAVYGTDAAGADWNAEAAESAQDYLRSSSFSRQGLIDQLLFEGFTQTQAEYGVNTTGL